MAAITRIAICAHDLMFVLTGSEWARRSPLCVFWYHHTIFDLNVFILIPSVMLGNSRSYPMGVLKRERTFNSLRHLCAIIAIIYDLSHNYIVTNNNYDAAVNRTRDLIVGGT